jgi:tetratricopeptide (TPR) repeat protein
MKRITFLLIVFNWSLGYAQIDIKKYYDPESLIMNNLSDHLKVDFKWTMKGNLQALINEGINQLDENNIPIALFNLNKAIKLDSSLWISHYYRGICHKKLAAYKAAEQDFLTAISFNPKVPEAHMELGEIYLADRELKEASDQFVSSVTINPKWAKGYFGMANVSFLNREFGRATNLYTKCTLLDPKFTDAYLMIALIDLKARYKTTEAIAQITKAIEVDSTYSPAYFWRGMAYLDDANPKACQKDWDKLIMLNPRNHFYIMMRGFLNIEIGDFDKAFIDLKTALKAQEINEDKFVGGQTVLDKRIDLHAAANYLIANGYGLNDESFSYLKIGFCMLLAGNYMGAVNAIIHAKRIEPSATAFFLLAIAFEHTGIHLEALSNYTYALNLDNDIFDAHKKRTVYRMEMADWKGAHEDIKDMFRLQPGSPVAFRLRGLVKAHERDNKGAIADLNEFLKTDTADVEVIRCRSICYTLLGERDAAIQDIDWLLKRNEADWVLNDQMVDNCIILKDTVKAISILNVFIQKQPAMFEPYLKLTEILIIQNRQLAKPLITKISGMITPDTYPLEYSKIYLWQGILAFHDTDYTMAIARFEQALQTNGGNLDAIYHRAKVYEATGDFKKARSDYGILAKQNFKDSKILYKSLGKK